jgi:hypothetical protein
MQLAREQSDAAAIDPITLEVIHRGLVSITNQIDANIKRTAFSPYIYEYNDFAVGLVDAGGQLVAQCTGGMPPFVADSVGTAVRDGLKVYGSERLHHGDVVVCNHAAVQGQHLNNTVMYTPIRVATAGEDGGRLIGFIGSRSAARCRYRATSSWKDCSCVRSSFCRRANRSRKFTASSRTIRANRAN